MEDSKLEFAPVSVQFLRSLQEATVVSPCGVDGTFYIVRRRRKLAPREPQGLFVDSAEQKVSDVFPCTSIATPLPIFVPDLVSETNSLCFHGQRSVQRIATGRGNPLNKGRSYNVCDQHKVCSFFKWSDDISSVTVEACQPQNIADVTLVDQMEAWDGVEQGSTKWLALRQGRLTASNFGCVTGTSAFGSQREYIRQVVYKIQQTGKPLSYGSCNEGAAYSAFQKFVSENCESEHYLEEKGIWISKKFPFLGSSPDGIFYLVKDVVQQGEIFEIVRCFRYLLEIKTPWKLRHLSAIDGDSFYPLCETPDGRKGCVPPHYYDQIIGNCNLIGLRGCFFLVATPVGYQITYVPNDEKSQDYWNARVLPKLDRFHHTVQSTLSQVVSQGSIPGFLPDELA